MTVKVLSLTDPSLQGKSSLPVVNGHVHRRMGPWGSSGKARPPTSKLTSEAVASTTQSWKCRASDHWTFLHKREQERVWGKKIRLSSLSFVSECNLSHTEAFSLPSNVSFTNKCKEQCWGSIRSLPHRLASAHPNIDIFCSLCPSFIHSFACRCSKTTHTQEGEKVVWLDPYFPTKRKLRFLLLLCLAWCTIAYFLFHCENNALIAIKCKTKQRRHNKGNIHDNEMID